MIMDTKKICPLLSIGSSINECVCEENDCAWYIAETESCAMSILAKSSVYLSSTVDYDTCCDNYYIRSRKA